MTGSSIFHKMEENGDKLAKATEPHRKGIGWTSIALGVIGMSMVVGIAAIEHHGAMLERNQAQEERERAASDRDQAMRERDLAMASAKHAIEQREKATRERENLTRIEDSIRDMIFSNHRPMIIKHMGTSEPGDEKIINWPPAAEKLLGWTLCDVQEGGLEIMIPTGLFEKDTCHDQKLEEFVNRPVEEQTTSVVTTEALHKDGRHIPVRITVWVVGDKTRSLAALVDPIDRVRETTIRRKKAI